ncbi:hypothetical protein B0T10DRAFT_81685 [Thelonectria olida]|uniref:CRAL-TRIO domain-containing protein n=1 Tax=Thelonectria olida TaxID=1576542 RepID=A0A9P9AK27_9HYPO|nr:hypothetical protein B0T10DRAFT_81685 [Thelonectria olida]
MKPQLRRFLCLDRLRLKPTLPPLRHLPVQPTASVRYSIRPRQRPLPTCELAETKRFSSSSQKTSFEGPRVALRNSIPSSKTTSHQSCLKRSLTSYTVTPRRTSGTTTDTELPTEHFRIEANLFYPSVVATAIVAALFIASFWTSGDTSTDPNTEELIENMAYEVPPGRPGNLTAEQEDKLRKLWAAIFQLTGVADDDNTSPSDSTSTKEKEEVIAIEGDGHKKKRFGVFRRKADGKSGTSTPTSTEPKDGGEDDKYGQTKQYYETLAKETPESIRATIWSMVKHDHPDALVLRFLRARKWDVEKALVMLVSTMNWRHSEMGVDDDIMKNGDGAAIEDEKNADSPTNQVSKDVMAQLRMGKSFLHGTDKDGRPICVVRVRLHKQGEQCEASLERYTVYIIETARMVLEPPVDTACVVFDMTGFSMANMDYTPVKFMIKCFEANYPESLGAVLVHKAPWIFQGIWKIIRGWLDPVVAAKVHFTNNKAELEEFIAPGHIIKELEGEEAWEYKYIEPIAGENDKMKDTATRDRLLAAREELVKKFEHATRQWIRTPDEVIKAEREHLSKQLREDYWNLDPYIRARTLYDRQGSIQGGGKTDWYSPKPVAAAATETSADDVD